MDIDWVVVDRYKMPGGATREHTDALVQEIFAGRAPIFEDERLTVYETWEPEQRLPFIEIGADWGPLQPGPRRTVPGAATLIIHSPDRAPQTLIITPAADNAIPFRLEDENGRVTGKSGGATLTISLDLRPGPNRFVLKSERAGLTIREVTLARTDDMIQD
jgi:hypothetical protein